MDCFGTYISQNGITSEAEWQKWVPSGGTVAPRIRLLQAPSLVDIRPSCPVAGHRKRGCLLQPVSGCPLRGSFSPPVYIPIPLSLLMLLPGSCTQHTLTHVGFWGRVCSVGVASLRCFTHLWARLDSRGTWPGTLGQALAHCAWLSEALGPLGYWVGPLPGGLGALLLM